MIKKLWGILFLLMVSVPCVSTSAVAFKPQFKQSKKTTHKIPKGQEYIFGYLEVMENRSNPSSNTIQIPIYIFKSRSANPKPDPIIYTVGGPGATTMPSAQYMKFYKYLDDRDFILVEQRGNYYANPHLDCSAWSKAMYQSNQPGFNTAGYDELLQTAAKSCRERLERRKIDLNGYNTNEIAADINDLVNLLDIEKYNLLTISYSTKISQVLMRDYPEKIRSVVLDSPLPLEVNYDEESVKNLLASLDKLLTDCEADRSCNKAYPNLKDRFFKYLTEKTKNPLEVTIVNPKNGEDESFYLKGQDLIAVFSSTSTQGVSAVPYEISKLLKDDLSSVKEQLLSRFQEPGTGAGIGMRLSVWCAEESPFNSQEILSKETSNYPQIEGLSPAVFDEEICEIWNVKKVSEAENQPIESNIPVLIISGEYDHETPVKWAQAMMDNLTNSYHLIFNGWKHTPTTNWGNQCAMIAANDFFNNPNEKPKPDCFAQIKDTQFKVN